MLANPLVELANCECSGGEGAAFRSKCRDSGSTSLTILSAVEGAPKRMVEFTLSFEYDVFMQLQKNLLAWFHRNQRPLPWRKKYQPYEVWVSEIMLQQTQVETVLPYYHRWMKLFPDIKTLAKSDEKKVLKAWEGLGYYSRARNLHETAKKIVREFDAVFPEEFETILSLKGIGRYTAGAIASIAFNDNRPIVDGNILRVISRIYAIDKPIDVEKNKALFWKLQQRLIPKGRARFFNQALMELGALVCIKQNPACLICPIRQFCKAGKNGRPEDYPVKNKRKKMVKVEAVALVISKNGKYFIHKRPLGKIMGGLWEFPEWKLTGENRTSQKTVENAKKQFGTDLKNLEALAKIKRNYTHHLETMHVFSTVTTHGIKSAWPHVWVSKRDFARYPFSSAHAKIAALIRDGSR